MTGSPLRFAHPTLESDARARDARDIARLVDSTLLRPETSADQIVALCEEAARLGFRSVCVPPSCVSLARSVLAGLSSPAGDVLVCTVVGFPNGYNTSETKIFEARGAVLGGRGAQEIDFVQNAAWAKAGEEELLASETKALVEAVEGTLVKVILETSLLRGDEIAACSRIHARAGAHVIKTSTGFGARGATLTDIELIARALAEVTALTGLCYGIKASGGVRTREDALAHLALGVTRIGTSGGAKLLGSSRGEAGDASGKAPTGAY